MLALYIHAPSEAAAKAALGSFLDPEGNWIAATHRWVFNPAGFIVDEPAVFGGHMLISEVSFVPGWHANIRLLDEALAAKVEASGLPIPLSETPVRVWL